MLVEPNFASAASVTTMIGQLEEELRLRAEAEAGVAQRAVVCKTAAAAVTKLKSGGYTARLGKGYWNRCAKAYLQF